MKSVLTIGSSYMEQTLTANRMPAVGETLTDDGSVTYMPGGEDVFVAMALAKLGLKSAFCSKLGADLHGQRLFEHYKAAGLDTSFLKVDHDYETGMRLNFRADGGERRLVFPGANQNLTAENVADVFEPDPGAVFLGFSLPFPTLLAAAKNAEARGVPIFLCANDLCEEMRTDILPQAEIFYAGEEDTERLTGVRPTGHAEALKAALALYRKVNCRYLLIRLSGRGTFFYDGRHYRLLPPVSGARPKNTDDKKARTAYLAALIYAVLFGYPVDGAVTVASAAEAFVYTSEDKDVGYPTDEDVREMLNKNNV